VHKSLSARSHPGLTGGQARFALVRASGAACRGAKRERIPRAFRRAPTLVTECRLRVN
jgi:hypothetical protein